MRAVDETKGEVILYGGELIEVAYSSSFGGASEDANNVWGTDTTHDHPYLCGVEDPYESRPGQPELPRPLDRVLHRGGAGLSPAQQGLWRGELHRLSGAGSTRSWAT